MPAEVPAVTEPPPPPALPSPVVDPTFVAFNRELRDRYLEAANDPESPHALPATGARRGPARALPEARPSVPALPAAA